MDPIETSKTRWFSRWIAMSIPVVLIGAAVTIAAGYFMDARLRSSLISRAGTIAAGIDDDEVYRLSGTPADIGTDAYEDIKKGFLDMRDANNDVRFIYLMGFRGEQLFFYVDSEPVDSPDYSAPGDLYSDASPENIANTLAGDVFTEGPYTDSWGTWVSGYAPVRDRVTGEVLGSLGIDISVKQWREMILLAALAPILATLVVLALMLFYLKSHSQQREKMAREVQERKKLKTLIDELPIGVFLVKLPSGEPIMKNHAAEILVGQGVFPDAASTQSTLVYKLKKESGEPYPVEELPLSITITTRERAEKKDIVIYQQNQKIILHSVSIPVFDEQGRFTSAVVIFEDITHERALEKMKSGFLAMVSRQFHIPLADIYAASKVLIQGGAGKLLGEQKTIVQQINTNSDHLIKLVENLLHVAHLEAGQKFEIAKRPADMIAIIDSALHDLENAAKNYDVKIQKDVGLPDKLILSLDEEKIRYVISSLLSNALKFSKPGGTVTISQQVQGDMVQFTVTDTGIGIPASQQPHIFERLFRAENVQSAQFEGMGVDLYIVKAIIEGHKGKIWFESVENQGTTFFVQLPR